MHTEILVTLIVAIFASTGFWQLITALMTNRSKAKTAEEKMLLGLGFKAIKDTCITLLAQGEVDADEYKDLALYLFEPYRALGGDGTAERLIKEVDRLPIKERR